MGTWVSDYDIEHARLYMQIAVTNMLGGGMAAEYPGDLIDASLRS
jgi:hypothetical protein